MSTILAVIEPSVHPQEVVGRAAWVARLTGSRLRLLLCDPEVKSLLQRFIVSNAGKTIAADLRAAQQAMIDELAAPVRAAGVDVDTQILEDRPVADAVLQKALEIDPSILIKGTSYHSHARRAVFVDTDWQLIRSSPYPLWLVKPHEIANKPVIVAAVDPTHEDDARAELDRRIVEQARDFAEKTGGDLLLLHTFEALTGIGAEATRTFKPIRLPTAELSRQIEQEHRKKLEEFANACKVDLSKTHVLPGRAPDLIPWFAREHNADLVVIGAIARWGRRTRVIGSTAEKALDDLPCDILIVKPPD